MYKNLIELFKENEGKGAVGAFNLHCFEMLPAMISAAGELNVPIIIQTSLGTAEYIGFEPLIAAVKALAEKSSVSVALHMDHCKSVEALKKAIDLGYSSVMYDGSALPIEENIKNTKEVVAYAHAHGVSVEGEIGSIGGAEEGVVVEKDAAMYTKPEDALYYVDETHVDALAVSIGTTHGQFKSKAKINYELLTELKAKLGPVGLVLHGGTGVSDEDMKRCVREGMKKINVGTELNKNYIEVVSKTFTADDEIETPHSYIFSNQENGSRTLFNFPGERKNIKYTYPDVDVSVILSDGHEPEISVEAIHHYKEAISVIDAGTCRESTMQVAKEVDYLVCSEDFARQYTGMEINLDNSKKTCEVFEEVEKINHKHVVITLGEKGLLYRRDGKIIHMPAFKVKAIDTNGAGDIFHGAFAYGMHKKLDFYDVLKISSMASAISVQTLGAQSSIPQLTKVTSEIQKKGDHYDERRYL